MMSTVTTAAAAGGVNAAFGAVVTLVLILTIAQRELAMVGGSRLRPLVRVLTVVIAPLLIVFTVTVVRQLAALI